MIYVDNILVIGTHSSHIFVVIVKLQQMFKLKDIKNLGYFLGIQATQFSTSLHLQQAKYITNLLSRTKILGAKPYSSPCLAGSKLSTAHGEPLSLTEVTAFCQIVGALQYCTLTLLDIAFSINQLCLHMHNPSSHHWATVKRMFQYLKGVVDHGLWYTKGNLTLQAFCNSDWEDNPDDHRSTTGFGIFLGSSLFLGMLRSNLWLRTQVLRLNIVL